MTWLYLSITEPVTDEHRARRTEFWNSLQELANRRVQNRLPPPPRNDRRPRDR
ncbi:MAG: hypothetical protein HC802_06760 [Caldilineaceae bacterium]|nr:hypothetical protein [Caldilineaceae bacterium]